MTAALPTAPARATLPPPGPVWFSSVMGTGILATLLGREGLRWPALALLLIGVLLLVGLSAGFAARARRHPEVLRDSLADPTWGTVAMGILSIGSAILTVTPQYGISGQSAFRLDLAFWFIGTILGLATALGFTTALLTRDLGDPLPAWGLPLVPPMVTSTTGTALVDYVASPTARIALLTICSACFVLSLTLGGIVFGVVYRHLARGGTLPLAASISAWIPLGVVGQSTAAAQAITAHSLLDLTPDAHEALAHLANVYGYLMLALAVPVVTYAVRMTVRGFTGGMPFSPGWWALTFPIGTLALGSRMLGFDTHSALISGFGVLVTGVLCCTWTFCAFSTVRSVLTQAPSRTQ